MHLILVHSTESPQEAEELTARLREAGVVTEVRDVGASALVGILDATRRTWELWVPDSAETVARNLIDGQSKALDADRAELDAEVEAESVQAAPLPEAAHLPEPKPVPVVTRNARIAGALMLADVFLAIMEQIVLSIRADPAPLLPQTYIRWGIEAVVAVALWNGSRGARLLSTAWVVINAIYYSFGTLDYAPIAPMSVVTETVSLLLLLLGNDSRPRRFIAVTLWVSTTLVAWFPLTLAPGVFTNDQLVGQWHRQGKPAWAVIAFCSDGRVIEQNDKAAFEGQWRRVGLYEISMSQGQDEPRRHVYAAHPDYLLLMGARWDRDRGASLCGGTEPH